jgi:ATP-dependent DNA helicase RecQ
VTEKTERHGHERLSVFGIGTQLSANAWRSVIRQLVVRGLLRADLDGFGSLQLTERSRPLLRGEIALELREDPKQIAATKKKPRQPKLALADEHRELWQALRECRRLIASEQGVPPYVIFHDATLTEMAAVRPASAEALLDISGVGQAKLARYGERFLEVIRRAAPAQSGA